MKFNSWLLIEEVAMSTLLEMAKEMDDELLDRIESGDSAALDQLIIRWEPRIRGMVKKHIESNPEYAEDVAQQTLLKIVQALQNGTKPLHFKSWVFRIAKHEAIGLHRKRKNTEFTDDPEETSYMQSAQRSSGGIPMMSRDDESDPASIVANKEVLATMRQQMQSLPAYQQDALQRRYFGQESEKDMAGNLGVPQGTVKRRIHAAKERLRDLMRQNGYEG